MKPRLKSSLVTIPQLPSKMVAGVVVLPLAVGETGVLGGVHKSGVDWVSADNASIFGVLVRG
jgi:hypothetical protein